MGTKQYFFGLTGLVAAAMTVAILVDIDVAVSWAAICMTISLWSLSKLYPMLREQHRDNPHCSAVVAVGMTAGFVVPVFINVITPLAFGGLVGVGISAVMQVVIGYRTAVKSM